MVVATTRSTSSKKRVDRAAVLVAAEVIVDRDGTAALTMSALARELGLQVSSLYNHVPSLEALRGELQNRAMRDLGVELRNEAMGKTGERGLRALAHCLRAFAGAHPGRYGLAMSEPFDREGFAAASQDCMAAFAAIIASYGVDDPSLEFQVSAFAALHGVVVLDNAGFLAPVFDADHIFETVLDQVVELMRSAALTGGRKAG